MYRGFMLKVFKLFVFVMLTAFPVLAGKVVVSVPKDAAAVEKYAAGPRSPLLMRRTVSAAERNLTSQF